MIKLGKVLSVNEKKRDLVLSVDWLGGSKCTLRTWSTFLASIFSKKGSKCKSASIYIYIYI